MKPSGGFSNSLVSFIGFGSYEVSLIDEVFDPTAFINRIPVKIGFISLFFGGFEGLIL